VSIDVTTYCGWGLLVPEEELFPLDLVASCDHDFCKGDKFCPTCGKPAKTVQRTDPYKLGTWPNTGFDGLDIVRKSRFGQYFIGKFHHIFSDGHGEPPLLVPTSDIRQLNQVILYKIPAPLLHTGTWGFWHFLVWGN